MLHSQVWNTSVCMYNQWLKRRGFDQVPFTTEEQNLLELDQNTDIPCQLEGWDTITTNVGSEQFSIEDNWDY